MSFRFVCDAPVRWQDVDAQGVLNNAVYLTLLEEARYGYFDGLGLLAAGGGEFPFLLGECSIRFLAPARAGEELEVAARTVRLGTKSLEQAYEVRRGTDVLAVASATLVWVGPDGTPPVPDDARARIVRYEGDGAIDTLRAPA